jgi:pimeloyl-ACP methyl ester carboxylesterase
MSKGIISERRTCKRADGRVLGFAEYGDPAGLVVLAFHGVPGTRLMYRPAAALAEEYGLRIIAPDRPGFGLSEPQPGRVLADWLDDVAALLKHLDVGDFALLGISGGCPFATITAAHYGGRVKALALVSPMGPIAEVHNHVDISKLQQKFFLQLPLKERLFKWGTAGANALFKMAPGANYDLFVRTLCAADQEIMRQPEIKKHVIEDNQESLTFDGEGARADMMIFSQPWGVDYRCITAPAMLWQGTADTVVPINAALALGKLVPGCKVIELDDEGHFWGLRETKEILERLRQLAARHETEQ